MTSRERRAYHEAAHAVAYIATRKRFRLVTIVPNEEKGTGGAVSHRTITEAIVEQMLVQSLLDYAFISLAAPAHDEWRYGHYDEDECRQDHRDAIDYIAKADFNMQARYDEQWQRAEKFVRTPRRQAQVERVAQALLDQDTLSYQQVQALLK